MLNWYCYCFKKFFTLEGRASRAEFWSFVAMNFIVQFVLSFIAAFLIESGSNIELGQTAYGVCALFVLINILPSIAVTVRRLHDVDFSGWWFLLNFVPFGSLVLLVFMLLSPTQANRFGERAPSNPGDEIPPSTPNEAPYSDRPTAEPEKPATPRLPQGFSSINQTQEPENMTSTANKEHVSLLDELMGQSTSQTQSSSQTSKPAVKPNSPTHRPVRAEESSLVDQLNELSKK